MQEFRRSFMRVKTLALIFAYISLATAFLIAAAKQVTIREFDVPTPKSHFVGHVRNGARHLLQLINRNRR